MPGEISQTLDRGLRVLDVLAASPDGLTMTELAARMEVNRTIVHRLVATLETRALVRREGDLRQALDGGRDRRLRRQVGQGGRLVHLAAPRLGQLHRRRTGRGGRL